MDNIYELDVSDFFPLPANHQGHSIEFYIERVNGDDEITATYCVHDDVTGQKFELETLSYEDLLDSLKLFGERNPNSAALRKYIVQNVQVFLAEFEDYCCEFDDDYSKECAAETREYWNDYHSVRRA